MAWKHFTQEQLDECLARIGDVPPVPEEILRASARIWVEAEQATQRES